LALAVSPLSSARAQEEPADDPRMRVAEIAALAEIGPTVCPDIETRTPTVMKWLAQAGLSQADLTERYGTPARAVAEGFLESVHEDQEAACAKLVEGLGDDGLGLVGKKAE
jgi:hypothetical protein